MKVVHLLIILTGISFFACGQEEDANPYHYNKVYDYENDTLPKRSFHVDSLLRFADRLVGSPYKSPGRSPEGFDCSGFSFYCFRAHSIYLPYSAHEQAEIGKNISKTETESGDLIFFQGYDLNDKSVHHVGIVVSKKGEKIRFVHSSSKGVHYEFLESPYYQSRFLGIRRVY